MRVEEKNKPARKFNNVYRGKPNFNKPTFKSKDMPSKPGHAGNASLGSRNKHFNPRNVPFNRRNTPFNPRIASINPENLPLYPKNAPFNQVNANIKPRIQNFKSRNTAFGSKGQTFDKFLMHAIQFGKLGQYGYGTRIDKEMHAYLISMLASVCRVSITPQEKTTMANKFLKRITDEEISIASNQVGCKALMDIISFTGPEQLEHFMKVFSENLSTLYADKYASRVLVHLMETAFLRAVGEKQINPEIIEPQAKKPKLPPKDKVQYNISEEYSESHRSKCSEFIQTASQFALDNLAYLVDDYGGSKFLRQCILSLVGLYVPIYTHDRGAAFSVLDALRFQPNADQQNGIMVKGSKAFQVPTDWIKLMKEFVSKLEGLSGFNEFPYMAIASVSLQVLCVVLSHVDKTALKDFYKKLLKESFIDADVIAIAAREQAKMQFKPKKISNGRKKKGFGEDKKKQEDKDSDEEKIEKDSDDEDKDDEKDSDEKEEENSENEEDVESSDGDEQKIPNEEDSDEGNENCKYSLDDGPSVLAVVHSRRLLTALIMAGGPELLQEIYTDLLAERFMDLATKKWTHFIVEAFLQKISDKVLFKQICNELLERVDEFPENIAASLMSAIAAACARLNTKQDKFIAALKKLLNCEGVDKEKAFFACLLQMKPYKDKASENVEFVLKLGARIVESILNFKDPGLIVNFILEMQPTQVARWSKGYFSFVAFEFFKSKSIDGESRKKFIDRLKGQYFHLAISKVGNDVVQYLFAAGDLNQKTQIVEELIQDSRIRKSVLGKLLWDNFKMETYRNDPEQWQTFWSEVNTTVSPKTKAAKVSKVKNSKVAIKPKDEEITATSDPEDELIATPKPKVKKTISTPIPHRKIATAIAEPEQNETTTTPKLKVKKPKAKKRPAPA